MILVELRCDRCRELLATIDSAPDWTATITISPCRRCHKRREKRLIARRFLSGRRAALVVALRLPAASLRPFVERAWATGTTQVETIRGVRRGD